MYYLWVYKCSSNLRYNTPYILYQLRLSMKRNVDYSQNQSNAARVLWGQNAELLDFEARGKIIYRCDPKS